MARYSGVARCLVLLVAYNSNQCTGDVIAPATKFSVPTVANGFVYLGTQETHMSNGQIVNTGLGKLYIFGSHMGC